MRLWATKCMRCHGQIGAGDGPDGPALGVINLSDASWQSTVADERLANSIRNGRGSMPSFALSPEEVESLIALIRQMGIRAEPLPSTPGTAASPLEQPTGP